jgi:hypothetical protein
MDSLQKVRSYLDQMNDAPDSALQEALPFPVPAGLIRMALNAAEAQLPSSPTALDALIDRGIEFLQNLRSDTLPELTP